jgi:hypothetical protein
MDAVPAAWRRAIARATCANVLVVDGSAHVGIPAVELEPPRPRAGVACLVACPTISGLVLGLIAMAFSYPTGAGHAFAVGSLVGGTTFVANALAICLTACTVRAHAIREARSA